MVPVRAEIAGASDLAVRRVPSCLILSANFRIDCKRTIDDGDGFESEVAALRNKVFFSTVGCYPKDRTPFGTNVSLVVADFLMIIFWG